MRTYRFSQVDVFGAGPLRGNPLAVVHAADDLDDAQLQRFAHWTGLSETTFLLQPTEPGADYRVRIFTTERELPFAGHPTLGSAAAWLVAGGIPADPDRVIQQCGAGLVPLRSEGRLLAFAAPPLTRYAPIDDDLRARITAGLGLADGDVLDASWLVNGPEWIGIRLGSIERLRSVRVDPSLAGLDLGLVAPQPAGADTDVEVRALLPGGTPAEDPVTGSLNAGLARWLIDTGVAPGRYVASQGREVGADGRVSISDETDGLWIGGAARVVISGDVRI